MPKTKGAINKDHQDRREALLTRLRDRVQEGTGTGLGIRALAQAMNVSVPTVRHYFGSRRGVIEALLRSYGELGKEHLEKLRLIPGPFEIWVPGAVNFIASGFRFGPLTQLNGFGIAEGVLDAALGPSYLTYALEGLVRMCEERLSAFVLDGTMRKADTRHASLGLISPILVTFLHQNGLNGRDDYPMDIDEFLTNHAEAFVRAYRLVAVDRGGN